MIKIIGQETGKIYAEGYKSDCFRKLSEKYPFKIGENSILKSKSVYPEPLMVVRM